MIPIWRGTVKTNQLLLINSKEYEQYLSTLEGKEIEVVVRKKTKNRSSNQNSYYWGVVIEIISQDTGYDRNEMHDILRGLFLSKEINVFNHHITTVKSTTDLTTVQFEEYLSKIRTWASKELSIYIPEPNEVEIK